MRITITGRHGVVPDELRVRARSLLDRITRVASRPHHGQAIFDADHGRALVELRLHTVRQQVHVATAEGPDHRTALDRAAGRLRRQLDKATRHRRRPSLRALR
ncbi:MAG TPA: HPF/RaiA family ribosome-associated protein [Gemmatimonadales bacterium]|nr:HPF/RaiA family ribosome-associated protein [Gemmatimonadales bacterium]